ncbi:HEPN domain-containing protein [Oscillatoria sp. CS-180]|uniref:HEPN domain-containing protein n=1 Tax=Oscillatoria sp. CS-180 TaxID=3021720 RepID=UPI00233153E3|nr:HEPN domain-containing protein [Oscillatoria sp. CS-180]MDB9525790.1 HEPN domain-containing protein [Oscillatoria sp. CS-180]
MANRSQDWLNQAQRDLQQAIASEAASLHEWACFAAHQAGEKAIRALHLSCGQEAWGHLLFCLLSELPPSLEVPSLLLEQARVLDNFYIPTRYPDSHPEGSPFEHYGPLQSQEAIRYARAIFEFVDSSMAE